MTLSKAAQRLQALRAKPARAKKKPTREQVLAALQESGVSRYEERMKASGRSLRIVLPSGGIFHSRGWRGCPRCEQRVDIQVELQPFATSEDGVSTIGWRCVRP